MKLLLVIAAVLALCAAAPQSDPRQAVIVEQTNDNIGVGPWSWGFKTSDGLARQESGNIKNEGTDAEAIEVRGSFEYTGADGTKYVVNYIADENGFQPQGAHIPSGRK